jgi:hypothetical protein
VRGALALWVYRILLYRCEYSKKVDHNHCFFDIFMGAPVSSTLYIYNIRPCTPTHVSDPSSERSVPKDLIPGA